MEPSARVGVTESQDLLGRLAETSRSDTSRETDALRLTLLDVNDVLRRLAPRLVRILRKQRMLALSLAPDVGLVVADARQLEQVVVDAALDARGVMPADGSLWISTRNVAPAPLDDARSNDRAERGAPRGFVCVQVSHSDDETDATVYLPRVL